MRFFIVVTYRKFPSGFWKVRIAEILQRAYQSLDIRRPTMWSFVETSLEAYCVQPTIDTVGISYGD